MEGMARRGNHNTPTALFLHHRDNVLTTEKNALQIYGLDPVPILYRCGHHRFRYLCGGIRKEHVDPAAAVEHALDCSAYLGITADVHLQGESIPLILPDALRQGQNGGFILIHQEDRGSIL